MEEFNLLTFLKKIYFKFLDTSQSILFIVSIFLIIYIFVAQPHEVSGHSMHPTFKDKEYLLSYLLDVKFNSLRHGDVVVFHAPVDDEKLFIKRVIGLPGDKVRVEGGEVYLNDAKLDESAYLDKTISTYGASFMRDGETKVVLPGTLLVMGDNRQYSSDSREWGLLDEKKLVGRSSIRIWPISIIERDPYGK